jgi:RNA polymerase sigma-54 factor
MKLMKKRNLYTNQLQIKKSLRTKIYEFLKEEIKKEGIKKKSDEELSNIFNLKFDTKVSRKTIAKYREELKIPSSINRK